MNCCDLCQTALGKHAALLEGVPAAEVLLPTCLFTQSPTISLAEVHGMSGMPASIHNAALSRSA